MGRWLYTGLLRLLAPWLLLHAALQLLLDRGRGARLAERWGFGASLPPGSLWLHAVSVGEVQAAAVLVRALRSTHPDLPLLVTTTTATGAARVRELFGTTVRHRYLPLDYPGAVRRFLDRVRPCQWVILETELWPNLLAACATRGIPVRLVSARLSVRTAGRYRQLRGLFAPLLDQVSVLAQTDEDARRYRALGVKDTQCEVGGNLKFDLEFTPAQRAAGHDFRAAWQVSGSRFVWVAGSTHDGEEQILLAAHARLRESLPGALLVLAPRHPPRFAAAAANIIDSGLPSARRSLGDAVTADTAVLLVDTLGELLACYLAADAAFVGGSLVPVGGHSLLEPAAAGVPLFSGPQVFNAPEVAAALRGAGALVEVDDADALVEGLAAVAGDPALAKARGAAALAVVARGRGALARAMTVIGAALPGHSREQLSD